MSSSSAGSAAAQGAANPVLREIATDRIQKAIGWNTAIPAPTWARIIVNDAYQEADAQVKAAAKTLIELTQDKEFLWEHLCNMESNPEEHESVELSEVFRRASLPTPTSPETEVGQGTSPQTSPQLADAEADWGETAEDLEFDRQLDEVTARAVDEARAAALEIAHPHKRPRK